MTRLSIEAARRATSSASQCRRPDFGNIPVELRPRAVLWWMQIRVRRRGFWSDL